MFRPRGNYICQALRTTYSVPGYMAKVYIYISFLTPVSVGVTDISARGTKAHGEDLLDWYFEKEMLTDVGCSEFHFGLKIGPTA
jgi:hypothetical protein